MNTLKLSDKTMSDLRALLAKCSDNEEHFELLVRLHESGMPFDTFSVSETLVNAIRINSKNINPDILDRLISAGMPLRSDNPADKSSLADILVAGPSEFAPEVLQEMFDSLLASGDSFMEAPHFDGNRLHRIINYPGTWFAQPSGILAIKVILKSSVLSFKEKLILFTEEDSSGDTPIESLLRKRLVTSGDYSHETIDLLYMAGSPQPRFERLRAYYESLPPMARQAPTVEDLEKYCLELTSRKAAVLMRHGAGIEEQAKARFRM